MNRDFLEAELHGKAAGVEYDHGRNLHTITGARAALNRLFEGKAPKSIIDVGCGRGTWLRAALELGAELVRGVDGVAIADSDLLFPRERFLQCDLAAPLELGERFDVAICLEVAEHLEPDASAALVASLARHADLIYFSAAAPGQLGQHHVNCQWPDYWQRLFNQHGFVCDDRPRQLLWNLEEIEPWYRQNMFVARLAPDLAGKEEPLRPLVHPAMLEGRVFDLFAREQKAGIACVEAGFMPVSWYLSIVPRAAAAKLKRRFRKQDRDAESIAGPPVGAKA